MRFFSHDGRLAGFFFMDMAVLVDPFRTGREKLSQCKETREVQSERPLSEEESLDDGPGSVTLLPRGGSFFGPKGFGQGGEGRGGEGSGRGEGRERGQVGLLDHPP